MPPIRVLLVDDSPIALTILQRLLSSSPDIDVVGTARNGIDALTLIPQLQPTVICTDLYMPKMSGLEFIQRIMAESPRPILVISASVQEDNTDNVFQLLQAGALDIFPKPQTGSAYEHAKEQLINRIRVLSGVSVFTQHNQFKSTPPSSAPSRVQPSRTIAAPPPTKPTSIPAVVAIGASTGGPQALYSILKRLPATFPVPILCVQHISEGFLQGLLDWLASECALRVAIARPGDIPRTGTIYFPPERQHLHITPQGHFAISKSPPVAGHCPSVTVLFQSVAAYYQQNAVGILLTGMGRDGAEGLLAMAQQGATTIAQNEQSCVVFGMPKEAIALGAAQHVLPLNEIAPTLLMHCKK